MDNLDSLKGSKNILDIFKVVNYKRKFAKNNPTYFYPERIIGILCRAGSREDT